VTVRELNAILDDPRTHAEWRSTVTAGKTNMDWMQYRRGLFTRFSTCGFPGWGPDGSGAVPLKKPLP
jgi:hypothetical protein